MDMIEDTKTIARAICITAEMPDDPQDKLNLGNNIIAESCRSVVQYYTLAIRRLRQEHSNVLSAAAEGKRDDESAIEAARELKGMIDEFEACLDSDCRAAGEAAKAVVVDFGLFPTGPRE